MGNKESNESAAVKRQAEGFANPMYRLLDLMVINILYLTVEHNSFKVWRTVCGTVQKGTNYWKHN